MIIYVVSAGETHSSASSPFLTSLIDDHDDDDYDDGDDDGDHDDHGQCSGEDDDEKCLPLCQHIVWSR